VYWLVCFYLWFSLRWPAKLAGGSWLLVGVLYGAIRTRGFRRKVVLFDETEV
jgi:putrescine importer